MLQYPRRGFETPNAHLSRKSFNAPSLHRSVCRQKWPSSSPRSSRGTPGCSPRRCSALASRKTPVAVAPASGLPLAPLDRIHPPGLLPTHLPHHREPSLTGSPGRCPPSAAVPAPAPTPLPPSPLTPRPPLAPAAFRGRRRLWRCRHRAGLTLPDPGQAGLLSRLFSAGSCHRLRALRRWWLFLECPSSRTGESSVAWQRRTKRLRGPL